MKEKKIISILGDSISTFQGYSPRLFDFYDEYTQKQAGIASVEDTWWMKVINYMDGILGYNDSISGSTVTGRISLSATSLNRLKNLAINGVPDIILLYMGTNDWACSVLPEEFEEEYRDLLYSLLTLYPDAEIYCANILRGKDVDDPWDRFFNVDQCVSPRIYSGIIKKCAQKAGAHLVDLEKYNMEYETIDGVHPDVNGMATIADLWMREIEKGEE